MLVLFVFASKEYMHLEVFPIFGLPCYLTKRRTMHAHPTVLCKRQLEKYSNTCIAEELVATSWLLWR